MNAVVKIVGGVAVIVVGVAVAAPFLVPTQTIIDQISKQAESTTGRTLQIAGDSEVSILPSLNVTLNNVRLSNMTTGSAEDMLSMEQLSVHIPWLSLLSGEAKLERFVIHNPTVTLETDKQGQPNWQLFPTQDNLPTLAQTKTTQQPSAVSLPSGFDVSLGEVAIYGGSITYIDGQTGVQHSVNELDLSIQLPSLYKALTVNGAITYQSQKFELMSVVDTPAKAIVGEAFNIEQRLTSQLLNLEFNGVVAHQGKDIQGELTLAGESVKAVTQWQNIALPAKDNAFNQFSVAGSMSFVGNTFTLNSLVAKLDELEIKGQSKIVLGPKPNINANIDLGMLDLNPYLPEPAATPAPDKPDAQTPSQPIVWDDTPIDLSVLGQVNADIVVRSTGLKAHDITLGENQFSLQLKNNVAHLGLDEFNAYNGTGKGSVKINSAVTPYKIKTNFALKNINAEPLLTDAVGFDKVLGKGSIDWNLTTQGQSQKQLVSTLAGNVAFSFKDGGVKGANIAQMARKAKEMLKGDFSSLKDGLNADYDPQQKTDFSALTGSFVFKEGVGRNNDLSLASPLIRITGSGEVDLPKTNVNYRLVTGIVDTVEGQASADKSTGFKVPLRIKGPFHKVDVSLDISSAAKDNVKDKLKDKLKDKFKGLFGG
ncbi:AsmA family protein [Pseudoalteromonas aurantia]|uniref:AsmA family protein n=1 Tax=Pseudoalteromonas aurantia TaxID=43654 RepID=A0ABY2W329_9GAMM|nr:AsmA family protein [Pseudoalteromonas aurantia]TMO67461.1 AsmA family protein [Pseudoalteromonas aurantia]TMO78759.1 AsmA family protein [Pseudoalteromonas aurantia]